MKLPLLRIVRSVFVSGFVGFLANAQAAYSASGNSGTYGVSSSTVLPNEQKQKPVSGFGAEDLPSGWDMKNPKRKPDSRSYTEHSIFRGALGGGLGFPDVFPLEGYIFLGRYFGLRGFYSLPYPFKIRVELPSDDIRAQNGFKFANPDLTINFDAVYGPHYGMDAMVLPFAGAFYVGLGVSHRRIHVEGGGESPLVICSNQTATPCSEQASTIVTKSQLALHADVTTQSWMLRTTVGWFWELGDDFYFNTQLGLARPYTVDRDVTVTSGIVTPDNASGETLSDALVQVKKEKESELEGKIIEAIEPYDSKTLPIVGFSFGLRF